MLRLHVLLLLLPDMPMHMANRSSLLWCSRNTYRLIWFSLNTFATWSNTSFWRTTQGDFIFLWYHEEYILPYDSHNKSIWMGIGSISLKYTIYGYFSFPLFPHKEYDLHRHTFSNCVSRKFFSLWLCKFNLLL